MKVSHIGHFKFLRSHISKEKKAGEINFNNICQLILYQKYQQTIHIKILMRYSTSLFLTFSPQNIICILHLQNISAWTSHTSNSPQPRVPTVSGSAGLEVPRTQKILCTFHPLTYLCKSKQYGCYAVKQDLIFPSSNMKLQISLLFLWCHCFPVS